MKAKIVAGAAAAALALAALGATLAFGGGRAGRTAAAHVTAARACPAAWAGGWQRLADRVRHSRDHLHREPGRRPVARPARMALPRLALRGERARDQPVQLGDAREEEPAPCPRRPRARPPRRLMRLTRRRFLGSAAAAGLAGAGLYELVDRLGTAPSRPATASPKLAREQHVFDLATVDSEGVEVLVPPLHSEVVTAKLRVSSLREAQHELEQTLRELDERYAPEPAGLGVTPAWGLPYFDAHVPGQAQSHLPLDRRADKSVLPPTRRFPSDPPDTLLESNDVAVLLRSDSLDHIADARKALFERLPFFQVTSIRRGFAGGGFEGGQSLPKKMAMAAGVRGADLIPDTSELFLGFTSTQKAGLGPRLIANHETLGFVDLRSGYFHGGTHMHLSHIVEDLEAWYLNFDFDERVLTAFRPGLTDVKQGAQTVSQGPKDVATAEQLAAGFHRTGRIGHSSSIQSTSRLQQDFLVPPRRHRSFPLAELSA